VVLVAGRLVVVPPAPVCIKIGVIYERGWASAEVPPPVQGSTDGDPFPIPTNDAGIDEMVQGEAV
jgi:hypothetical protein